MLDSSLLRFYVIFECLMVFNMVNKEEPTSNTTKFFFRTPRLDRVSETEELQDNVLDFVFVIL